MSDLKSLILQILQEHPGSKASEIASYAGSDNHVVNSLLYGKLSGLCTRDKHYRWYLTADYKQKNSETIEFKPTELTSLCEYYLSCLGYDDENGISVFAESKYNDQEYCEIEQLLDIDVNVMLSSVEGQRLISLLNKQSNAKALYLGYPCYLSHLISKRTNWEGFLLEPLLFIPITKSDKDRSYEIANQAPIFNYKAIKDLTSLDDASITQEINDLEEEMGFNNDELPEWADLISNLVHIRQGWKWRGVMNPEVLDTAKKISELKEAGIYNKAVVILADRSPYTVGLESELKSLSQLPTEKYKETALGQWLSGAITSSAESSFEDLLEVFPMNLEQRLAISKALSEPLTSITGPPGTGKSQVVANLLVNSFWKGKRVLFASKNNQAVDVVEARVNSMGSRPILLRTGSNEYRDKLANYLVNYATTTPSQTTTQEIDLIKQKRGKLVARLKALATEEEQFVLQRNALDGVEIALETLRDKVSPLEFRNVRTMDLAAAKICIDSLSQAINRASKDKQPVFVKIFWVLYAKKRMLDLKETTAHVQPTLLLATDEKIVFTEPQTYLQRWSEVHKVNSEAWHDMMKIKVYLQELKQFQQLRPLEGISQERKALYENLSNLDYRYWSLYLESLPSKLNNEQKRRLSELKVSVQVLNDMPQNMNEKEVQKLKRRHYDLLFDLSQVFPCWAVTALSARGRIPFEPGYFDLLIIDEASQCDIASVLPLLFRAKNAVIIGDDKQLKHISKLPEKQDLRLLAKFDPEFKRLIWMYSKNSLFDLSKAINNMDTVILQDHHRSHSNIIEFSNRFFYQSSLRIATKMDLLKTNKLGEQGVRWINVSGFTNRPSNGGAYNDKEATEVINQLQRLTIKNGYLGSIGVVTPFRAQANLIREKLKRLPDMDVCVNRNQILVDVVHKYQGDEKDVMIFSPVLSTNMPQGGLRFLEKNPNLFNVAITRARSLLLVVGDLAACKKCSVEYLKKFAEYSQEQIEHDSQQTSYDLEALTDEYPIVADMSKVSDWEIFLYKAMFSRGIRAIPQYSVDQFVLDFALFEGGRKLDIEVDGEHYHKNWNGELCRRDQLRNQRMYELGWDVMRFWVYEIRDDLDSVLDHLEDWMNSCSSNQNS